MPRHNSQQYAFRPIAIALLGPLSLVSFPVFSQGALEEVVVTARKRAESLQDVPIAISAFTGETLNERGLTNVAQIADWTPGLEMDPTAAISGSSATLTTFIRGIGMSDFLLTIDPGVGLYVDDVYVARSVGGLVDLLDVERIEVLKGPQGTLFGRNTIGGAVSVHSRAPDSVLSGTAGVTVGSDNRLDFRGRVSIPLSDNLTSSWAFSSKTQDGFGKRLPFPDGFTPKSVPPGTAPDAYNGGNVYGNGDRLGEVNTQSVRAKVHYDLDNFQARLSVDGSRARETAPPSTLLGFAPTFGTGAALADAHNAAVLGVLAPGVPPIDSAIYDERWITGDKHTTYGNAFSQSDYDLFGISLTAIWQFDNFELKSITAYRDLDSEFGRDGDSSPIILDHTHNRYEHEQLSQEFQLSGLAMDDRLSWVGGVYFFREEGFDRVQVPLGLEVDLGVAGVPGAVINLWLDEANDVKNTSQALFAQTTYDFSQKFSATVGVRYTKDDKEYNPVHVTQGINPLELLIAQAEEEFTDVSPRVSLDYRFTDQVFAYASYSAGFKSGGFTGRTVDPQAGVRPFQPEEAETVELGLKMDFEKIRINGAIFTTDYSDLQIINQEGITPITVNAGESTIEGMEVEIQAVPIENLQLVFGYSYLNAEYSEITDPNATIDESFEFANTPKHSFNASADYTLYTDNGASWLMRADYAWKDDHYNDAENTELLKQDAFGILNLVVSYRPSATWTFNGGVSNATDEKYLFSGFSQPGVGFVEGSFDRGRQYYLEARYDF